MGLTTFWAMGETDQVMYRCPGEPLFYDIGSESQPVSLVSHLATMVHGSAYTLSLDISDSILGHQTGIGLSSDWVTDGVWMSSFDPVSVINDLSEPGSGVAWHLLGNNRFIGAYVYSTIEFSGIDNGYHWGVDNSILSLDFHYPVPEDFALDDLVRITGVSFMGFSQNTDGTSYSTSEFTQVSNGYTHNPAFQEFGQLSLRPGSSSAAFNPAFTISADAFPDNSPGLFTDSLISQHPDILAMQAHMANTGFHVTIDDSSISGDTAFSADVIYDLARTNYNDMPPSGDGWLLDGVLFTPGTDVSLTNEYIAIGGSELGYVEVLHPDTDQVLATSVNGQGGIWAKFSIDFDKTPVVPPGVALRKLNQSTGYGRDIPDLRLDTP